MAFGASKKIWGGKLLPEVQRNLALIATTIAKYESVTLLVRKDEHEQAKTLLGSARVELVDWEVGEVRAGYLADIILIDGDPLKDIRLLQQRSRILAVMKGGVFYRAPGDAQRRWHGAC